MISVPTPEIAAVAMETKLAFYGRKEAELLSSAEEQPQHAARLKDAAEAWRRLADLRKFVANRQNSVDETLAKLSRTRV